MSSNFITNREKIMSEVVSDLIPKSQSLSFLIGYFYFSGFFELYKSLEHKELRILVGLEVEKQLGSAMREIERIEDGNTRVSNKQIKDDFMESFVNLINNTDFCDTSEKREAFHLFLSKIKNGTLKIKKTKEPNHAKLYIFENLEEDTIKGTFPGTIITGSSNLTASGLRNRFEINVISREAADYEISKKIFDELWESSNSVTIVDEANIDVFLFQIKENTWIEKTPKPYLVFIRVIHELFSIPDKKVSLPGHITKGEYFNLKYQADAIKEGLDIIEKHNGVIIADVVGLGKSIIASAIAHNLGVQTIVICPPHLEEQWDDYGRVFKFSPEVYTSGKIEKAYEDYKNIDSEKLIIIDEAHKYRNEQTDNYKNLHSLCVGNKVLLLTATPFNNKPQDIYSMIKLFQVVGRSTIRTVDNLAERFKDLIIDYKKLKKIDDMVEQQKEIKRIAGLIRAILAPLVVRRSRIDLEKIPEYKDDLTKQGIAFPEMVPPKLFKYDLGELEESYISTLEKIVDEDEGFRGAKYKPASYILNERKDKYSEEFERLFKEKNLIFESGVSLAKFMRRLLVGRFESSIKAFEFTLDNMVASMELTKSWYERFACVPINKGKIVEPEDLIDDSSDDDEELRSIDEGLEKLRETKGYYYIKKKDLKLSFLTDLNKDIELLRTIKSEWVENMKRFQDPKIEELKRKIKHLLTENPKRKIIIFTGYKDTAYYAHDCIKDDFRTFIYSSKEASVSNKETIKLNFDAGIEQEKQLDDYDILIATDAISEGYNLHRAGVVINYDIPYNPTRVIQRVGRINRINKKVFEKLFIYNSFPTIIGESETRVKNISTIKVNMINSLLGNDFMVLTDQEELGSFYDNVENYYQGQFKKARNDEDEESWETKYRSILSSTSREVVNKSLEIKPRTKIARKGEENGLIIFAKKGNNFMFKYANNNEHSEILTPEEALGLMDANETENPLALSKKFDTYYEKVKSNLFVYEEKLRSDKGEADVKAKLEKLKERCPEEFDYLDDLEYMSRELKMLIGQDAKYIRNIYLDDKKTSDEEVKTILKDLKKEITPKYISEIMDAAKRIDEGEESLVVIEEFIND